MNVVVYISKLGKAYSLFVQNTDEVALRKELTEKGISKADVDSLVGDPKSPLSRTSGTSWGTVPSRWLYRRKPCRCGPRGSCSLRGNAGKS